MYRSFRRSLLHDGFINYGNTFYHPTALTLTDAYKERDMRIPLDSRGRSTKITMATALRRYTHICQVEAAINGTDNASCQRKVAPSQSHRPVLDPSYGRTPH